MTTDDELIEEYEVTERPPERDVPYTYVEVTVQLSERDQVVFRREFGQPDDDVLEKLDLLVDAIKSYLESD